MEINTVEDEGSFLWRGFVSYRVDHKSYIWCDAIFVLKIVVTEYAFLFFYCCKGVYS